LQVAGCKLQVAGCKLQVAGCSAFSLASPFQQLNQGYTADNTVGLRILQSTIRLRACWEIRFQPTNDIFAPALLSKIKQITRYVIIF
jgi:hypothetical protein